MVNLSRMIIEQLAFFGSVICLVVVRLDEQMLRHRAGSHDCGHVGRNQFKLRHENPLNFLWNSENSRDPFPISYTSARGWARDALPTSLDWILTRERERGGEGIVPRSRIFPSLCDRRICKAKRAGTFLIKKIIRSQILRLSVELKCFECLDISVRYPSLLSIDLFHCNAVRKNALIKSCIYFEAPKL